VTAWRRANRVPRAVQVGREDQLMYVDLGARAGAAELVREGTRGGRVFEIWPPLDRLVDRHGRRVEAVVGVVTHAPAAARAIAITRDAGSVAPPRRQAPETAWRSWKLFGTRERATALLLGAVWPAVRAGRLAGEIERWFFLPYVDGPGRRDHLRLRVSGAHLDRFARRLTAALAPARAAGDLVLMESGDFFPERARFGADALAAVLAVFESDSELACTLAGDERPPPVVLCGSLDALARGAGFDLAARHEFAAERRAAYSIPRDPRAPFARLYRDSQRDLLALLSAPSRPLVAHRARVRRALASLSSAHRARLLLPLTHLAAVRLCGPHRESELCALYLWERALEGLLARGGGAPPGAPS
jgi:thiopeptide-type bacteriocin biosynthesis protein